MYGRCSTSNWPPRNDVRRSSAGRVLRATVASKTRIPRLRSSGTRAATTFSMPPYPSDGTDSHGPAFISTVRVTGQPSGAFAPEIDG